MTDLRQLLTTARVAELMHVSRRTVHRMATDGRLRAVAKLDGETGAYVFDADEIDELVRTQHAEAGAR